MPVSLAMATDPTQPQSVLDTVLEWSLTRPGWIRDALRRIVRNSEITESDLGQIELLCLTEHEATADVSPPVAQHLGPNDIPNTPLPTESVVLDSIEDIDGANQLAPGQTLEFAESGLTIIYGRNGSGKSGYARLLKRSCRARNRGPEIEPDVFATSAPSGASAQIDYRVGDQRESIRWIDSANAMVPDLSAVSVFDADCGTIHVEGRNEVAYIPFGLDVPERLASVVRTIRSRLEAKRRAVGEAAAIFKTPTWSATSIVGRQLSALTHSSDYRAIAALAVLSSTERSRLEALTELLAGNPSVRAQQVRLEIGRAQRLLDFLSTVDTELSDAVLDTATKKTIEASQKQRIARVASEAIFSDAPVPGIGEETWRALWEAARRFSDTVVYPDNGFPSVRDGVLCVLCHQPLGPGAKTRMTAFEKFIKDDTTAQAELATRASVEALQALQGVATDVSGHQDTLAELGRNDPELVGVVEDFVASARARQERHLKWLRDDTHRNGSKPLVPLTVSPATKLKQHIEHLQQAATDLEQAGSSAGRKKLVDEMADLRDRDALGTLLPIIKGEIDRLLAVHRLDRCIEGTNTRSITELGTRLAETTITNQLRDRFAKELIDLAGSRIRAELSYAGGKTGKPQYQVRLIANPKAEVAQVLSEGEKTCVALAGFLTELATARHESSLVFDDPVCSLDHRWRLSVATRLVEEARHRQVIVFTHDIVFVHDLKDHADRVSVGCELRGLRRSSSGTGVVEDGHPWVVKRVEARLDELTKRARAAKLHADSGDEKRYSDDAQNIYNDLRATWERALEEVAFQRTVVRHRDYIDSKNLTKVSALTLADCAEFRKHFKKCSDVISAHDSSPGRDPEPPEPTELLADIKALADWVAALRVRQKQVS